MKNILITGGAVISSQCRHQPGTNRRYAIDSSKIKNELGWEPKYNFNKGIDKTIDWYINKLL